MFLGLAVSLGASGLGLPAGAQTLRGDGSVTCGEDYVVASGDTLSRVSERAYGDPMLYPLIVDANPEALGGNPEHLGVGMSITVPCVDVNGEPMTAEAAAEAAKSLAAVVEAEGPLSAQELDTLFGPVALFPDPVLTPVLVATTFPIDVVKAARFVDSAADLSDEERAADAAGQTWDNSVRELAAGFPDLVSRMNDHIDWTEQAGEAVVAQTDEVLAAIQRLRARAKLNGYLVDNQAQKVEEVNDKIVISPATPGVVYVPTYDSDVVYAKPLASPPSYYYGYDYGYVYHDDDDWDDMLVAGGIILGGAIILDEIFDDDDWDGWDGDDDIDWDGGDITIDRDEINIDRGDINVGDGDRPQIGDGDRVSIGDSDRTQVDRAALAERAGDRTRAGTLPSSRASISNPASRDVARQKIQARKSTGAGAAKLPTSRPAGARAAGSPRRDMTQARTARPGARTVARPQTSRTATQRSPGRSTVFHQPSRSPSMAGNRGRASVGGGGRGRGGGGFGGGGRGGGGRGGGGRGR